MALWHDPTSPFGRPDLIDDLLAVPAKASNHQLENQSTTVLAWLIDNSEVISADVLELFLPGLTSRGDAVGARTQVSMPKPSGGAVYPDLSICVGDKVWQLLVEVKVTADMNQYPDFGGVEQPALYRRLWSNLEHGEAHQRAVGTLTRAGGDSAADPDVMRAREVSWGEIGEMLRRQLDDRALEPGIQVVAGSMTRAIEGRIAPTPPSPEALETFYRERWTEIESVVSALAGLTLPLQSPKATGGKAFKGFRLRVRDVCGDAVVLRVYLAKAGSGLTLPGAPDALIIGLERDADGTLSEEDRLRASEGGFAWVKDLDGFLLTRRVFPLDELILRDLVDEASQAVRRSGVVEISDR